MTCQEVAKQHWWRRQPSEGGTAGKRRRVVLEWTLAPEHQQCWTALWQLSRRNFLAQYDDDDDDDDNEDETVMKHPAVRVAMSLSADHCCGTFRLLNRRRVPSRTKLSSHMLCFTIQCWRTSPNLPRKKMTLTVHWSTICRYASCQSVVCWWFIGFLYRRKFSRRWGLLYGRSSSALPHFELTKIKPN